MAIRDPEPLRTAWLSLAEQANHMPDAARQALRAQLRRFNHDFGDRIGMIRAAEAILRRDAQKGQLADEEILDILRDAASDLVELLHLLQAFVQTIRE